MKTARSAPPLSPPIYRKFLGTSSSLSVVTGKFVCAASLRFLAELWARYALPGYFFRAAVLSPLSSLPGPGLAALTLVSSPLRLRGSSLN
jgi:hypothetical protein